MKNAPALAALSLATLATLAMGAFGGGCSTFGEDTSAASDDGGASEGRVVDAMGPVVPGGTQLGTSMTSFLSPSDPTSGGLATAEPIPWVLATFDSTKLTVDTTEGTNAPTILPTSSIVALPKLNDNTVIRWTVDGDPTPHAFTASIDTVRQGDDDGYVSGFQFTKTNAPTVVVSAGSNEMLEARANVAMWSGNRSAGGNIHQFLYGIDDAILGCLVDAPAPTFSAGPVRPAVNVQIPAPKVAGIHKIRIAFTTEPSCDAAMRATNASLGTTEIGAILVH